MAKNFFKFKPDMTAIRRRLRKFAAQFKDLSVPNKKVSIYLDRWVQSNFRTQGGKVGGWAPFKYGGRLVSAGSFKSSRQGAAQSLSGRRKVDASAKLLQLTGTLRKSMRPFYNRTVAGIGSDLSYSEYHNEGTTHVHQRRMLPQKHEVLKGIVAIHNNYAKSVAGRKLW